MASQRDEHEGGEPEIKITDRRLFSLDGELRRDVTDAAEESEREEEPQHQETRPEPAAGAESTEGPPEQGFEHRPLDEPRGVDFTMLISAMAQPALMFLGEIPHPATGEAKLDLEQARIQIDMLELLRVKCRGNLESEEEGLLDRMLYQLRMLFVARSNQPQP